MRTITYSITPDHAGMSLERYLKQQHGYSTRTLVKLKHYPQGLQLKRPARPHRRPAAGRGHPGRHLSGQPGARGGTFYPLQPPGRDPL